MNCWSPIGAAMRMRQGYAGVIYYPGGPPAPPGSDYILGPGYLDTRPVASTLWTYRDGCGRVVVDRGTYEDVLRRRERKTSHGSRRFGP